jgi:hypothetical protein
VGSGQKKTPGRRVGGTRVRVDGWAYSGVDAPGKYEHPDDGHDGEVNRGPAVASNQWEGRTASWEVVVPDEAGPGQGQTTYR